MWTGLEKPQGFTLAELLIALAILGVIATFTIPKVLMGFQRSSSMTLTKEATGMLANAYMTHRQKGLLHAGTKSADLTPYINYVSLDTASQVDNDPFDADFISCSAAEPCVQLHTGAKILFYDTSFAGTATTNAIWFLIDPDGVPTGKYDSLWFAVYYNGRVGTWGTCAPGTTDSSGEWDCPEPAADPSWLKWD